MSLSYAARIAARYGYHIIYMDNVTPATHDIVLARNELAEVLGSDTEYECRQPAWTLSGASATDLVSF
jgi:hypothetical protein